MHFCQDEAMVIITAVSTGPQVIWNWIKLRAGRLVGC